MTIQLCITICAILVALLPLIHLCFLFLLFTIPKIFEGIYRFGINNIAIISLYSYIVYIIVRIGVILIQVLEKNNDIY